MPEKNTEEKLKFIEDILETKLEPWQRLWLKNMYDNPESKFELNTGRGNV